MSSNTNALLPLTKKEVEQIISENMPDYLSKRFEVLFNDIPFSHEDYEKDEDEDASDFKEDDGREFRWFIRFAVKPRPLGRGYKAIIFK